LHANPILYASQLFIGLARSILGGYVAARIAGREELLNGTLSSWLCISFDPSVEIGAFIASPAAGLLGGYVRQKQTPREKA
jgi:fructose-specific phosphotransferase system IIC component